MNSVADLYICSTYYHVYITLIKVLINKKKADIVICDDIPEHHKLMLSLIKANCFHNVYYFERSSVTEAFGRNKLDWIFFQHKRNRKQIEKAFKIDVHRYEHVYIYHDDIILGRYLQDVRKRYNLIEDSKDFFKIIGQTQFAKLLPNNPSLKFRLKKMLNAGYYPMGQSRYTESIEVNDVNGIVNLGGNVIECAKDLVIGKLTQEEKELLYKIFIGGNNVTLGHNDILILTQPLFLDNYVDSEEKQVRIYQRLIEDYRDKWSVVIKPHPRDSVDYNKYLSDIRIIDKDLPVEVLNFNHKISFKYVITIFSTSIFSIEFADEKIMVGLEYLDKVNLMEDTYGHNL